MNLVNNYKQNKGLKNDHMNLMMNQTSRIISNVIEDVQVIC